MPSIVHHAFPSQGAVHIDTVCSQEVLQTLARRFLGHWLLSAFYDSSWGFEGRRMERAAFNNALSDGGVRARELSLILSC